MSAGCSEAPEEEAEAYVEDDSAVVADYYGDDVAGEAAANGDSDYAAGDEEIESPAMSEDAAGDEWEAEEAAEEAAADADEGAAPARGPASVERRREIPSSDPDESRRMAMQIPGLPPVPDATPADAGDAAEDEPAGDAAAGDPGRAILAAPTEMDVGEYYAVKLLVGEEDRIEDLTRTAESIGSTTTSGPLELAPYVCGELDANGFDVREPLRQCQQRGRSPQVSFTWNVSPTTDRALTLQAKAITYDRENGSATDQRDSQTLQITVNADIFVKFNRLVRDLTESMGGLRNLLLAILAVLGVVSAIIWRLRNLGKSPDIGDTGATTTGAGDAGEEPIR